MSDFSKLVPAHVRKLVSYKPGKPRRQAELESGMHCIKMASNENPFGPSPLAIEAIKAAAREVNYYPDNTVTELTARLAELHGVETGQVLVTSGSSALLDIMARTLLGPGLNAITSALLHRLSYCHPRDRRAIHRSANRERWLRFRWHSRRG